MLLKIVIAISVASAAYFISVILRSSTKNDMLTEISNYGQQYSDLNSISSSVWCYYDKTLSKICTFKNICYDPETASFIFILKNESVISGLNSKVDLKTINLSSVDKHNNMFMKLQIVMNFYDYVGNYKNNVVFVRDPVLLMSRFKSDNIMHVIHDDVLPIFMTYDKLCFGNILECIKSNRLMFADDAVHSSNLEWYRIFSNKKPYFLKNLRAFTCFDKLFAGLSRETVWFQYGFGTPQGPLLSSTLDSPTLSRFKNYIVNEFSIGKMKLGSPDLLNVVFLSRKLNRKILNENFVIKKILEVSRDVYPKYNSRIKVYMLDPVQNKSSDILSVIINAQVLVGMHGSAMIYSSFLPDNAAIVELFPFGIQPQHVSSTRALTQLPGIFYNYLSWRNFKEINSVGFPKRPPLLGGIQHLPVEEQDRILKTKEVPAVECCHDPAYLYRMFQDTKIDESFPVIFKQVLINQRENTYNNEETPLNHYLKNNWFFPGAVFNISCRVDEINGVILFKWNKPYNLQISGSHVFYYVTIKIFSRVVTLETFSSTVSVRLSVEEQSNSVVEPNRIHIWIRAVADGIEGTEAHSYCR